MERRAQELLAKAGITINGVAPSDIQVRNPRVYRRVFAHGTLGFGEAYMDGDFEIEDLPEFFRRVFAARLHQELTTFSTLCYVLQARILDMQSLGRSRRVAKDHYGLGNELYQAMLGEYLAYTCGYWRGGANNLDEAQAAKLDRNCKQLQLQPGETLLDIGCGWGDQLKWAWENYRVSGIGTTLSEEQAQYAQALCRGMPIEIRVEDYRKTAGSFDKIISSGMFEHVGPKHYRGFMRKARSLLKNEDRGLMQLHTIGGIHSKRAGERWTNKYIFPGGVIPSAAQIFTAMDGIFVPIFMENIGPDYAPTLKVWRENFEAAWPKLQYGERFYRMWHFYLSAFEAGFGVRRHQVYRILLSPKGVPDGFALTL